MSVSRTRKNFSASTGVSLRCDYPPSLRHVGSALCEIPHSHNANRTLRNSTLANACQRLVHCGLERRPIDQAPPLPRNSNDVRRRDRQRHRGGMPLNQRRFSMPDDDASFASGPHDDCSAAPAARTLVVADRDRSGQFQTWPRR
jgi:hypothetical protein